MTPNALDVRTFAKQALLTPGTRENPDQKNIFLGGLTKETGHSTITLHEHH
jgi:hypothetical protein